MGLTATAVLKEAGITGPHAKEKNTGRGWGGLEREWNGHEDEKAGEREDAL